MFTLWFLIGIILIASIFLFASIYKPMGRYFSAIIKDFIDITSEEDSEEEKQ